MSSRILVIGGTGMLGRHLVTASLNAGHPTAVLVRPATAAADSGKAKLLEALEASGVNAVYRFVPSEYGCDVEQAEQALEPARSILTAKIRVRQAVRAAGIPHTFICSYWAHGLLPRLGNPEEDGPPTTRATIFGDEKSRAIFVDEKDMSTLAIQAVEDPRTLDKILYVRPPANICSFGQLVCLWEKKIGKTLEKHYISEQELVKKIEESPFPLNFQLAMVHSTLVAGACEQTINASVGVEATQLYPDMKFVTVEEYLDGLL